MRCEFENKVIVITGGSTGIGQAAVKGFVEAGGLVIFTGIEDESDIKIDENYGEGRLVPKYYKLDVSIEEDVKTFASWVEDKYNGCDVLFSNAGVLIDTGILHELPTEIWKKTLSINLDGIFFSSKYFLPQMIKKGGGAVVNTASMSGLFADYGWPSYNASKGAVANLTRNMALDYAKYNIRVNAVNPGSIRTSLYYSFTDAVGSKELLHFGQELVYPKGRNGFPEEVANAVLFLASDKASFITGTNLLVDGGLTAQTGGLHDWEAAKLLFEVRKDGGN